MKDYYKMLGVSRDTGQDDIKKSFRRLALLYHPDRNPQNQKQAEEKFKEINEAYQVLGDAAKRQQYDYVTAMSQYMQGSVISEEGSAGSSIHEMDIEMIQRMLVRMASQGFGFRRCGGGFRRRCQRW